MNRILQQVANQYWFRVSLTVICCLATVWFGVYQSYIWLGISSCLLVLSIIWQVRLYRLHIKQVLFMIDALENNDSAFRFPRRVRHSRKQTDQPGTQSGGTHLI